MPVLGFGTMPSQWGLKADEQFIKTVDAPSESAIAILTRLSSISMRPKSVKRYDAAFMKESSSVKNFSSVPSYGIRTEVMTGH